MARRDHPGEEGRLTTGVHVHIDTFQGQDPEISLRSFVSLLAKALLDHAILEVLLLRDLCELLGVVPITRPHRVESLKRGTGDRSKICVTRREVERGSDPMQRLSKTSEDERDVLHELLGSADEAPTTEEVDQHEARDVPVLLHDDLPCHGVPPGAVEEVTQRQRGADSAQLHLEKQKRKAHPMCFNFIQFHSISAPTFSMLMASKSSSSSSDSWASEENLLSFSLEKRRRDNPNTPAAGLC